MELIDKDALLKNLKSIRDGLIFITGGKNIQAEIKTFDCIMDIIHDFSNNCADEESPEELSDRAEKWWDYKPRFVMSINSENEDL